MYKQKNKAIKKTKTKTGEQRFCLFIEYTVSLSLMPAISLI